MQNTSNHNSPFENIKNNDNNNKKVKQNENNHLSTADSSNSTLHKEKDWRDNNDDQFYMGRFFANKKNLYSKPKPYYERKADYYCNNLFDYIIEWPDHCEFRKQKKLREERRIFQCTYIGCTKSYISMNGLKYHLRKKHNLNNE